MGTIDDSFNSSIATNSVMYKFICQILGNIHINLYIGSIFK